MSDVGKLPEIVDPPCWSLEPVDLSDFFRNVDKIIPEGAIFRLESGGTQVIEDFMACRPAKYPNEPEESRWLIFKTTKVFYMPLTKENLEGLANLSENYAEPEVGNGLGVYMDDELLLSWHDLPHDPIYVSPSIREESLKQFCEAVGCNFSMESYIG